MIPDPESLINIISIIRPLIEQVGGTEDKNEGMKVLIKTFNEHNL